MLNTEYKHGLGVYSRRLKHIPKALCRYCQIEVWYSPSPWLTFPPFGMKINLTGAACWVFRDRHAELWVRLLLKLLPWLLNGTGRCSLTSRLIACNIDNKNSLPHSSLDLLWLLFITWFLFDLWVLRNKKVKDGSEMASYSRHSFQHDNSVPQELIKKLKLLFFCKAEIKSQSRLFYIICISCSISH